MFQLDYVLVWQKLKSRLSTMKVRRIWQLYMIGLMSCCYATDLSVLVLFWFCLDGIVLSKGSIRLGDCTSTLLVALMASILSANKHFDEHYSKLIQYNASNELSAMPKILRCFCPSV